MPRAQALLSRAWRIPRMDVRIFKGIIGVVAYGRNPKLMQWHWIQQRTSERDQIVNKGLV